MSTRIITTTSTCQQCGEEVYDDQFTRHMFKDHNPEADRELELLGKLMDEGLSLNDIARLTA